MMIQTSRVAHVQKKLTANAALYIKVMGFVRHAHGDARALWLQGAVFSVGVLASFLVLAGLLLALRAGGAVWAVNP